MKVIKQLTETQLQEWMQMLRSSYYCCEQCGALHLNRHPFVEQGILLSVDVMEEYLTYSATAALRVDALLSVASILPELNSTYTGLKIFVDLETTACSQLMIQAVLPVHAGISFAQFTGFIYHAEADVAAVLNELMMRELLVGWLQDPTSSTNLNQLHRSAAAL